MVKIPYYENYKLKKVKVVLVAQNLVLKLCPRTFKEEELLLKRKSAYTIVRLTEIMVPEITVIL